MARRGMYCLIGVVIGVAFLIGLAPRLTQGTSEDFSFDAAKLKDATVWTKVNAEPYRMSAIVNTLCALPSKQRLEAERKANPHAEAFITVYVNNAAREAMFAKEPQTFPQGSVIVKEKIGNHFEDGKPLLYTIMRKREPGYNPSLGDWEFAVVGSNGKDVQGIGKLENCQNCHRTKRVSDFVYRTYVKLD